MIIDSQSESTYNVNHNQNLNHQNHDESVMNKSKYVDYDNRPIKPLDPNKLNKELSQYTELSKEELELLRNKYACKYLSWCTFILILN